MHEFESRMKLKSKQGIDTPLIGVLKKWEKIWGNLNECNVYFQSYIDTILLVHQKIKMEPLINSFEDLKDKSQKFYDYLDETIKASTGTQPVDVKLPWESDKFKTEWQGWKDYLKEQHQIVIGSRAENKQLEILVQITNNQEDAAYPILNYAMANLYKMFFKLEDKQPKTTKKPKTIRKDEDY